MEHIPLAIIGTGFGGLGMAIRLKQEGIQDFVVFERARSIGGTWRENTYPGCACDVESHLYSYSFAPNPRWSRMWSPQPEILAYLRDCAERFGVLPHIRFGENIAKAEWDNARKRWAVTTSTGGFTTDLLVSAMGALSEPATPPLPGIENFRGKVFHSARWDHDYELTGRRVAVIGTGASAIQFVPCIQPKVEKLYVLQRTPPWILPYFNRPVPQWKQRLFHAFPFSLKLRRLGIFLFRELTQIGFRHPNLMRFVEWIALRNLKRAVSDPGLRKKLTPSYTIGCKRVLLSDDYYPSLEQRNVELVTEGLREIRAGSLLTDDGVEREIDTLIFGTGFQLSEIHRAQHIRGREGRSLSEIWQGSPRAYLGTTVAGFPNLFLILGPNTGLGHSSVVLMIESQIAHILGAIRFLRKSGAKTIEPRPEHQATYNAALDEKMEGTVWTAGGCRSWYLDPTGRNSALWPASILKFRRRVKRFHPEEYVIGG